ncbi:MULTISPECIES: GIN domain-containing protein [Sphingomonas]|uniref:GIN domain-containing protein n=1 Tax=Sphingomonas TaxID=13687 RepID=UPI0015EB5B13|nr:DUF2807 domain-containing protein [Sphingomonas sp. CGMCC 1.13658]MBA2921032.1 DUF2807 domain-containing protein [Sphingomonas sp. CGMCC 1.13658]
MRLIALAGLALAASPAAAAERGYSVTSFDRIRLEGPFAVTVTTGKAVSAKATGSEEALERVSVRVEGRTMLIRPNLSGWGGYPGKQSGAATITVTTPGLDTAIVVGSGSLDVDRMKAPRVVLTVEGSGRLTVHGIDADNASLAVAGSGTIEVSGRAKVGAAVARGTAEIRAADLAVSDLTLTSESAGAITMQAGRSAKVNALGIGAIAVEGSAACEVRKVGGGPLTCGN